MSSVVISGDTSGAITLAAPAVAGTNTLTLPAATGTITSTADFGSSLTSNGYQKLPGGLIIQWGVTAPLGTNTNGTITFPTAFSTACLSVVTTSATGSSSLATLNVSAFTTTTYTYYAYGSGVFRWIAIGY